MMKCEHMHKDFPDNAICEDCNQEWNSEYHMSDECVNIDEDLKGGNENDRTS